MEDETSRSSLSAQPLSAGRAFPASRCRRCRSRRTVRALLTAPLARRTRKGFHTIRLLSAPDEKPFPSAGNVSKAPDRLPEEVPKREATGRLAPAAKEDGLCPCLNNFGRCSGTAYETPVAVTVSPYAPASVSFAPVIHPLRWRMSRDWCVRNQRCFTIAAAPPCGKLTLKELQPSLSWMVCTVPSHSLPLAS